MSRIDTIDHLFFISHFLFYVSAHFNREQVERKICMHYNLIATFPSCFRIPLSVEFNVVLQFSTFPRSNMLVVCWDSDNAFLAVECMLFRLTWGKSNASLELINRYRVSFIHAIRLICAANNRFTVNIQSGCIWIVFTETASASTPPRTEYQLHQNISFAAMTKRTCEQCMWHI